MNEQLQNYRTYLINIKRSTTYYNYLSPFFKYLQEKQIDFATLTKEQIAQYFTDKKYQSNSINNLIKAGRDFAKFLGQTVSPFLEITMVKVEKREREYLTLDDIDKSLKYISTYHNRLSSTKVDALLYFMFFTGVRKSEVIGLKRAEFHFENCAVKIYEQKTKQEKIVYYPEKVRAKIENYFKLEPEEENAFNITKETLDYLFRYVLSKYLGRKVNPHLTRHGGAKYMLSQGIPITAVQKILGHQNVTTTMIYLDLNQKEIEEEYKKRLK